MRQSKSIGGKKRAQYTYKRLGEHFEMGFIAEEFPEARTFPQIKVNGNYCGGYTEYETLVAKL